MPTEPAEPVSTPVNRYWKAVTFSSFVFVGTTLAIVMTPYGEQRSPVNRFLRHNGDWLAAIEVGVVLVCGVMAMATDQRQTREARRSSSAMDQSASGDSSDVG